MAPLKRMAVLALLVASGASSPTASAKHTLNIAHQARGVLTVEFDPSKSSLDSLRVVTSVQAGYQPGWLCFRDDNLYSVSRTHFPHNTSESGAVFAFQEGRAGSLKPIDDVSSNGNGGVFCDISRDGKLLSVANIDGSTVSIHPRDPDGQVAEASQTFKYDLATPGPGTNDSQIQANPHQAAFDPSGEFMFVPDRGADALYVYQVSPSHQVTQIQRHTLPPGTGPRHVTFRVVDQYRTLVFLVSELDNTVRVFTMDRLRNTCRGSGDSSTSETLQVKQIQTASTLGPGHNRTAPVNQNLASEVAVSNDGKFVYVANRNTVSLSSDTITIFSLNLRTTHNPLTFLGHNATYGKIPRHFSLSNDVENRYVSVANEVSNNLIILSRNIKTGALDGVVGNLTLGKFDETLQEGPMAVVWR